MSEIDDRTKTPRLSDLNSQFMNAVTGEERAANLVAFASLMPRDKEERALLKSAKELHLVLSKYLADSCA